MLCETTSLDNKEKEEDNLSGDRLINLKMLTTKIEKYLMCRQCEQEKAVQINQKTK